MKIATVFNGNLDQALAKWPDHLYVKNAIKRDNMVIIIDIRDATGKVNCITLPKTWIPIDLFDYVDKDSLVKSIQLRSHLRSGILKLIDAVSAEEVLATKEAAEEAKRCGIRNSRPDLTDEDESKSDVKEKIMPKASTDKMGFYDIQLMNLEDAKAEAEANKIVADVCGNYASTADDELFGNKKVTEAIQAMHGICEENKWNESLEKLNELLKLISENAPA